MKLISAAATLCIIAELGCGGSAPHMPDGGGSPDAGPPLIPRLTLMPTATPSTVPSNGDQNPYGVAFVPSGFPASSPAKPGDVLVSNFNNSANAQGAGSTIVRIDANGQQSVFFQGAQPLGLTTALAVLQKGFVLVGSVPIPSGTCTPGPNGELGGVGQGALILLDQQGQMIRNIESATSLNGPWDMTTIDDGDHATLFVSNILDGTVTRVDLQISSTDVTVGQMTRVASGYMHRCDPAAVVAGPTGLALDPASGTLYVASTADNAIYAVPNAAMATADQGTGKMLIQDSAHLHGPLGLVLAPNGDLIASQGDAVNADTQHTSEIVEYTAAGVFVAQRSLDPAAGGAFGMAIAQVGSGFTLAAVDDNQGALEIWKGL